MLELIRAQPCELGGYRVRYVNIMRIFRYFIVPVLLSSLISVFAEAEFLNSWARGSSSKFSELIAKAASTRCNSATCQLQISPIVVNFKTQRSGILRATLTSAELAAPIISGSAESNPEVATRRQDGPLLLRGWFYPVNSTKTPAPVAAVITRSSSTPILFMSALKLDDLQASSQIAALNRVTSLRLELKQLNQSKAKNARSELSSRYAFQNLSCAASHYRQRGSQSTAAKNPDIRANRSYPTLYVATDFDQQFSGKTRCSSVSACNDRIVRILHGSAVFYESQLGYTLTVARQFGPTAIGDETKPEQLLDAAQQSSLLARQQYLHTGANNTDNQVDVFQFFTGRTMDDRTIGIAYVGTACKNNQSPFSQAVVQNVSDVLNPITAAHEIGHLLNATHTTSGIMRPNLGNNTPKSFASSSLLEISTHLAAWYSECRQGFTEYLDTPTPTPTPRGSGPTRANPFTGKPITVKLTVSSPTRQTVSLSTTVTSITPQCPVIIRGGTTSLGALRSKPLIQFTPSELTTSKTATVGFKVNPTSSDGYNVYFVAEHTCGDGSILEVSRVQRFNPNRIRGISSSKRSKKSWLDALRRSLQ
jgi:hypothetical protein